MSSLTVFHKKQKPDFVIIYNSNSSQNPFNPDPSATVVYGEQSWDEMFFGEIVYKTVNQ